MSLKMKCLSEEISFSKKVIEDRLQQLDHKNEYEVKKLLYYPYFVFEYSMDRKGFFHPLQGKTGCTIDGVNKIGALTDIYPNLEENTLNEKEVIQPQIDLQESKVLAKTFMEEAIAKKKKIFTVPQLVDIREEKFFRPYWVVQGKGKKTNSFLLTVDAVSGKFHPL